MGKKSHKKEGKRKSRQETLVIGKQGSRKRKTGKRKG